MPNTEMTIEEYQALVAGLPKYSPNQVFSIAGKTYTAVQAVSLVSAILDAYAATAAAKGSYKDALAAEKTTLAANGSLVREIRRQVGVAFSNATTTLAALDIEPRKARKPLTTAERAAAAAKSEATRKARGTESKKQKALVSGDVTGVTITPITTGTASSTTPSSTAPATSAAPSAGVPGAVATAGSTAATGTHS